MDRMPAQTAKNMIDEPDATKPATMSATTAPSSAVRAGQTMKSSRRKTSKMIDSGQPLIPLNLGHPNKFSDLIEVVEPRRRSDELILSPQNIRVFLGLIEEFQHADTLRRHGLSIRSKLLFCGPPGCGKTLTAEVFARELGLPLMIARLDAIISSFLGETAANLRKLFDESNRQPCVLFLDEFDALARTRGDGSEHNELRRVVNSLLMMIDRYRGRGFLIAATNTEENLDPAIWRRFDEVILFGPPQDRQILQLVKLKTRNFPTSFDIRGKVTKLSGLSYADIERICVNAIKRSILRGSRSVLESEFNIAVREERRRENVRSRLKSKHP